MQEKAPGNRTLTCDREEQNRLSKQLFKLDASVAIDVLERKVVRGDAFREVCKLPKNFVDLLILDPPYNLSKDYNGYRFKERRQLDYGKWFDDLIQSLLPTLKPSATVYVCSDWKTSVSIAPVLQDYLTVRNRITWEREKGRGAKSNWKNNSEDIWFCTLSDDYHFDAGAVKLKRKVLAPYRVNGKPKDWGTENGENYRLTYPSNLWTDISVPFWSMPENTDHPTQKPEKLIAKLVLASSREGDMIFDPFLGSGTTAVVAEKLNRNFLGIELNQEYCCWALKRIDNARTEKNIQGYDNGVFWERNSSVQHKKSIPSNQRIKSLFT